MAMIKKSELRRLVLDAMATCDGTATALEGDSNPQIVELRVKAIAKREAFAAVFDALVGDPCMLKIEAYR